MNRERDLRIGVVLYRNEPGELKRLLRSFDRTRLEHPELRFDVVWTDNSPEPSAALKKLLKDQPLRHAPENLGFGATHNAMMHEAFKAGVPYYLCLNPDALLHPDCLTRLLGEAARSPNPGLVDAITFPDEHQKPYDLDTHDTPWCTGTALLISRALFEATGGFDDAIFMYCEDVDLSWRARALGFSVRTAPGALVHHHVEDRPIALSRELMVRRSAHYLGLKYGNHRFARAWKAEYEKLNGPSYPEPRPPKPTPAMRSVADFGHGLRFAESRW